MRERSTAEYSVRTNLCEPLSGEILGWSHDFVPEEILYSVDGREDEPHLTVMNGVKNASPRKLKWLTRSFFPFRCVLGEISLFDNNNLFDVLKIDVCGKEIYELNRMLVGQFDTMPRYEFIPHVTIAYLKKGTEWESRDFSGKSFVVSELIFSKKGAA